MTDSLVPDTEHVDPHALMLDVNVRDEAGLDAQFLASIKEHGVLIPIAATRGDDGQLRARAGQRRTLAAREAELTTVPVYVRNAAPADDTAQLVERVTEQIVENDQRRQLLDAQRARGIQQMTDAGIHYQLSAKRIVRQHVAISVSHTILPQSDTSDVIVPSDKQPDAGRQGGGNALPLRIRFCSMKSFECWVKA